MRIYSLIFVLCIGLFVGCSKDDSDSYYGDWSPDNQPEWLQDAVNDIVRNESGVSSYYPQLIMNAFSYKYEKSTYIAIQYSGILGDKIVDHIEYYTNSGNKVTSKKVQKAFPSAEPVLLWTNQLGAKEGSLHMSGVTICGVKNPLWMQNEIDCLLNEEILSLSIFSVEYNSYTYVALQYAGLNKNKEIVNNIIYYTCDGSEIGTSDSMFQELNKLYTNGTNLNLLWSVYLEYKV